jgi:ATP-binding cassette subfamily G (WHITE) protein 2 (PDR)
MGVRGAGKKTLLNVLAGRVSSGSLSGDIQINDQLRPPNFQRKVGYVQQFDTHDPTTTVREAVRFSSILRQSASISVSKRIEYSEHVLHILEMQDFSNAIFGVPGEGRSPRMLEDVHIK